MPLSLRSLHGMPAQVAHAPQAFNAAVRRIGTHFLVEGRAVVADLPHVAQHQGPRAGKIGQQIDVDLPLPRQASVRSTPEFAAMYGRVSESLARSASV